MILDRAIEVFLSFLLFLELLGQFQIAGLRLFMTACNISLVALRPIYYRDRMSDEQRCVRSAGPPRYG